MCGGRASQVEEAANTEILRVPLVCASNRKEGYKYTKENVVETRVGRQTGALSFVFIQVGSHLKALSWRVPRLIYTFKDHSAGYKWAVGLRVGTGESKAWL